MGLILSTSVDPPAGGYVEFAWIERFVLGQSDVKIGGNAKIFVSRQSAF